MDDCSAPLELSALACAIADHVRDNDALALLAAELVQLGDTLALIALKRQVCEDKKNAALTDTNAASRKEICCAGIKK